MGYWTDRARARVLHCEQSEQIPPAPVLLEDKPLRRDEGVRTNCEQTANKLRTNAPLLVPAPCRQCGWPTTVGPLCLRCKHRAPPCRACGSRRWWRPRPDADPGYVVCATCHPSPTSERAPRWGAPPVPPPGGPPDRLGHCRCLGGCGRLLPAGRAFCAAGPEA